MTHINEDKRKTEGQLIMFDIFNDIDNCPVSLLLIALGLCNVTKSEGSAGCLKSPEPSRIIIIYRLK